MTTVAQFLDWLAFQNSSVINWSQCSHISQLSDSMTTQKPYRYPGSISTSGTHIDCGIYLFLMIVLHTEAIPLDILLPISVHTFRRQLLVAIVDQSFPIEIHKLVCRRPPRCSDAEPANPSSTNLNLTRYAQMPASQNTPDVSGYLAEQRGWSLLWH